MRCRNSVAAAYLILIGLTVPLQPCAFAAGDSEFDQAIALFNQGQYLRANSLFEKVAKRNPQNRASALSWSAQCLYKVSRKEECRKLYQYIKDNFSGQYKADAEKMLQRLGYPEDIKESNSLIPGPTPGRRLEISGPTDFSDMIEVVKPLLDHPPVSPYLVKSVKTALKGLPPSISSLLRRNGTRIYITPTLTDKEPEVKNRLGKGYDGYTYKSCPGMFRHHAIYLCERTLDENDESVKEPFVSLDVINTFYHECGHAVDSYCGDFSLSEPFKHAYLLDSARMDGELKHELAYYLQKSDTGQKECCAELIAVILGKTGEKPGRMKSAFPQCYELVKKKLASI